MKRYDNVIISQVKDCENSQNEYVSVIVATVEELNDLWNWGYRAGLSDAGRQTKLPPVEFETYMESKGIKI